MVEYGIRTRASELFSIKYLIIQGEMIWVACPALASAVSNARQAIKAESAGVDCVVAEGHEAGGQNGKDELTTMVLVPQVVDAVKIPVIAAGGIADGRGILAAFPLGAEGVQIGTRFAISKESCAHENYKREVIESITP